MAESLTTHYLIEVTRAAKLFFENSERLYNIEFEQAYLISDKRDTWELSFIGFVENEDFAREFILHVAVPSLEVTVISDNRIR